MQEFLEANPFFDGSIFAEERILDVCILQVEEGILMHVCSQLGHVYSLLVVPQTSSNRNKVSLVVMSVATLIKPVEQLSKLVPYEACIRALAPDKL